ncbi:MAG: cytochrome c3 family protein, partial [Anaerolineae bacterium]|nr:cytochrome c3 family protein [Anaerolineae bacterium]
DEDAVSEELRFVNIHYYAAAAAKYGTITKSGYQYDGKSYDAAFAHVEGFETCIDCHDPHTLEVKISECEPCHGFSTVDEMKDVRMPSSVVDYDGDGNTAEGVYYEMAGMQALLYEAIQKYAAGVVGTGILYDPQTYPYFFIDGNGDGQVSDGEVIIANQYVSWTPRLLKAAYNYQVSMKDPGAYAHGGKYIIALLYDSIENLNVGVDLSKAHRIDHGHFAGSEEAFRHWDEEGEVSAGCSRCHSAEGLPLFVEEGVEITQEPSNGFKCSTCHAELTEYSRLDVTSVTFPSGVTVSSESVENNLCMTCHHGRSSTNTVNTRIAGIPDNTVSDTLGFINIHYFAAGATRYGADVMGAYQYDGKNYVGYFEHRGKADDCVDCHDAHELEVQTDVCYTCHDFDEAAGDVWAIRDDDSPDYDGDGNLEEGLYGEIETLQAYLYEAMQIYSENTIGTKLVYNGASYPYFFDAEGNRYVTWTPKLVQAAYNYQYAAKDPGAFAHNGKYIIQVLYDSLEDLGWPMAGMVRP